MPTRISAYFASLVTVFLVVTLTSQGQSQQQPPREESKSASAQAKAAPAKVGSAAQDGGPSACKDCHQAEYDSWEKSPHWRTTENGKGPLHQGCQACHGDAAAHLADPSDTSKLFLFSKASTEEVNKLCLSCHASDSEQAHAANSLHRDNGVSCVGCHSPHHATTKQHLLSKAQPELCYTCHLAQKPQFEMPFHHRVNEGLIECTDCHNPHGTAAPKQVRLADTQDQVCFKCHADKQGPFVYEHAPVKIDGCTSCHNTHGGPNPHMLKLSNVNLLCLQCHTTSSFSSAPGAPSFHNQATFFQACTLCHIAIHGSNFSPTFFK
ncbi:MAG TPA: DmsE family decaheme c-type cytochrome [Candidatus Cybelea sp.]|nr:DmsE family decaheme c-type cytochrome [Candidatus Cybelea sp.]